MHKVNSLLLKKDSFDSQEAFEDAIKRAVMVLLENEYVMTIRWDERSLGFVAIDYSEGDLGLGAPYPYWLSPEEAEEICLRGE